MEQLTWTNGKRKLSELIPWERNPREIEKDEAGRLEESLGEFGQVHAIAIEPSNKIVDGHQRQLVWSVAKKYGPDYEVDVRVSNRALTEKEREKLSVYLHRGATGKWNWDKLSDFDVPDLLEWGFEEFELGLGITGDTSTDRDGQGVSSTWDQVNSADTGPVIIGDIETRLPADTIEKLAQFLEVRYEKYNTPIFETLEAVVVAGMRSVESGDS